MKHYQLCNIVQSFQFMPAESELNSKVGKTVIVCVLTCLENLIRNVFSLDACICFVF